MRPNNRYEELLAMLHCSLLMIEDNIDNLDFFRQRDCLNEIENALASLQNIMSEINHSYAGSELGDD
jgi:predicted CoA-binding protein